MDSDDYEKTINNLKNRLEKCLLLFAPPPNLKVSEWADKYRKLSPESSAESGSWRTSRAEYQRGIMDVANEPRVKNVVFMSSAQVGKTEILNNVCGYFIDQNPKPILFLQPTLEMAEAWSKDRFSPMVRDTEVLKNKVFEAKGKSSSNTLLHKVFPGGHITIAGANSPSSLASRPIARVFCDEVDRYPLSAGAEGDPVSLARKRTTTFYDAQTWEVSTPTIKGISRIEARYEESDKRKFYVPCPDCQHKQILKWSNVVWEKDEKTKIDKPETAVYVCEKCGSCWNDAKRYKAISKGEWIAEAEFNGTAGFWLNEIYSSWVKLKDMVSNFLIARKTPETLKTFVNTSLGETWEEAEELEGIDENSLINRQEEYNKCLNNKILVITCGVDTQNDRLELEIVGWSMDEESWSIDYKVIYGNPSNKDVWRDLERILNEQEFETEDGRKLRISATAIDTGGHHTEDVYNFCKEQNKKAKRVFAIKGFNIPGKPIAPSKPSIVGRSNIKLFMIGVDTAKEVIYSRLLIKEDGPGCCHFPKRYNEEYFKQLTSEKIKTIFEKGKKKRQWVKIRPRNEALDCRVYALASLKILNPNFRLIALSNEKELKENVKVKAKTQTKIDNDWLENDYSNWIDRN